MQTKQTADSDVYVTITAPNGVTTSFREYAPLDVVLGEGNYEIRNGNWPHRRTAINQMKLHR